MEELVTQTLGFNFENMPNTLKLLNLLPINYSLVKRIFTTFSNLHVHEGMVYSLPLAKVFELRSYKANVQINKHQVQELLMTCGEIADENSALGFLFTGTQLTK